MTVTRSQAKRQQANDDSVAFVRDEWGNSNLQIGEDSFKHLLNVSRKISDDSFNLLNVLGIQDREYHQKEIPPLSSLVLIYELLCFLCKFKPDGQYYKIEMHKKSLAEGTHEEPAKEDEYQYYVQGVSGDMCDTIGEQIDYLKKNPQQLSSSDLIKIELQFAKGMIEMFEESKRFNSQTYEGPRVYSISSGTLFNPKTNLKPEVVSVIDDCLKELSSRLRS